MYMYVGVKHGHSHDSSFGFGIEKLMICLYPANLYKTIQNANKFYNLRSLCDRLFFFFFFSFEKYIEKLK